MTVIPLSASSWGWTPRFIAPYRLSSSAFSHDAGVTRPYTHLWIKTQWFWITVTVCHPLCSLHTTQPFCYFPILTLKLLAHYSIYKLSTTVPTSKTTFIKKIDKRLNGREILTSKHIIGKRIYIQASKYIVSLEYLKSFCHGSEIFVTNWSCFPFCLLLSRRWGTNLISSISNQLIPISLNIYLLT